MPDAIICENDEIGINKTENEERDKKGKEEKT